MELTLNISAIVAIIGALTVLTNIIVEVLKRATWEKMPTNLLAIIVAMVLTLVAFFGYMAFMGYAVMWYYVAAAVVVGFAVAYAAMFGFDKLKEALGEKSPGGGPENGHLPGDFLFRRACSGTARARYNIPE